MGMTAKSERFPDNLPPGWRALLDEEKNKDYFRSLTKFLKSEYQSGKKIFPSQDRILKALQSVDYDDVKVVILGQDPYHGTEQAVGLCFAVPGSLKPKPPSLVNIFKEIKSDLGVELSPQDSELTGWTKQGVLLLNTVLTVRANQAFSHRHKGWETFTDKIISILNQREKPIVFILWGAAAQSKTEIIDTKRHFILKAAHPSPLSAHKGFFGCKHFSRVNQILSEKIHSDPIQWQKAI